MFKSSQPFTFRSLSLYYLKEFFKRSLKHCRKVKGQKGASLYLAIVIMTILLAVVLGISAIVVGQIKMIKKMENSVIAFYAADTGIEQVLKVIIHDEGAGLQARYPDSDPTHYVPLLPGSAKYAVDVYCCCPGPGCSPDPCPVNTDPTCTCNGYRYCLKSVGIYGETRRAINVDL